RNLACSIRSALRLYLLLLAFLSPGMIEAVGNAVPLPGSSAPAVPSVGAGGMTWKYKRASGPMKFGGDLQMIGLRLFGGRKDDPKVGLAASTGTLSGSALQLEVRMGGITLEDSFRTDRNLKWRATLGAGRYDLHTRRTGFTVNSGGFAFFEPMFIGVIPMNKHISIELGGGYTFAGTTGVKLEGPFFEFNLLLGRNLEP
ncbi:MAG TPA: hypothetical protein PKO06_12595, partial [Candidatus Ozemobacteraceae bacterium]|nr:hypothetical protein [Candidatus Ozemobacteraceae bacterium]